MIHELRIYTAHPGKMVALLSRFRDHTCSLFEKHGITNVGYWLNSIGGRNDELWYIVGFESLAHREQAWAAFQAGDYAGAEALYREVRAADAGNIDALLGLGALAARGERLDEARDLYQAVLLAEPKNSTAVSALSTLPAGGARNLDASTLKNLVREQPGAANLHFALGLQYVARGSWSDAQSAFFEAVRNEPTNADYVYNLAVSLDQLGQAALAATYYQRALEIANSSSLFRPDDARTRLAVLRPTTP